MTYFVESKNVALQRIIFFTPSSLRRSGKVWEACLTTFPELYKDVPSYEQSDTIRLFIAKQKALEGHGSV